MKQNDSSSTLIEYYTPNKIPSSQELIILILIEGYLKKTSNPDTSEQTDTFTTQELLKLKKYETQVLLKLFNWSKNFNSLTFQKILNELKTLEDSFELEPKLLKLNSKQKYLEYQSNLELLSNLNISEYYTTWFNYTPPDEEFNVDDSYLDLGTFGDGKFPLNYTFSSYLIIRLAKLNSYKDLNNLIENSFGLISQRFNNFRLEEPTLITEGAYFANFITNLYQTFKTLNFTAALKLLNNLKAFISTIILDTNSPKEFYEGNSLVEINEKLINSNNTGNSGESEEDLISYKLNYIKAHESLTPQQLTLLNQIILNSSQKTLKFNFINYYYSLITKNFSESLENLKNYWLLVNNPNSTILTDMNLSFVLVKFGYVKDSIKILVKLYNNQKLLQSVKLNEFIKQLLKFILNNYSLTIDSIINANELSDDELKKLKFIKQSLTIQENSNTDIGKELEFELKNKNEIKGIGVINELADINYTMDSTTTQSSNQHFNNPSTQLINLVETCQKLVNNQQYSKAYDLLISSKMLSKSQNFTHFIILLIQLIEILIHSDHLHEALNLALKAQHSIKLNYLVGTKFDYCVELLLLQVYLELEDFEEFERVKEKVEVKFCNLESEYQFKFDILIIRYKFKQNYNDLTKLKLLSSEIDNLVQSYNYINETEEGKEGEFSRDFKLLDFIKLVILRKTQ